MNQIAVILSIYRKDNLSCVKESLDSLFTQTFSSTDIFLQLDGCIDNEVKGYLSNLPKTNIFIFERTQNKGLACSLNDLLRIVLPKGYQYVARMDADDISMPERFEKQVKLLDNNPNIGVVGCWHGFVGNNKIFKRPVSNKEIKNIIFWECPLHHPATMLRKSVLIENNIIYEEKYSPAEDFALWVYLFDKTDFYNIPEVLFIYRNNYENTTTVQNIKMEIGINNVLNHLITSHPREYERAEIKKKLKKHIKIMFSPLKYFLEPFAIIKYLFKLLMTKG